MLVACDGTHDAADLVAILFLSFGDFVADLTGVIAWDTVKGKDTIIGLGTAINVPG